MRASTRLLSACTCAIALCVIAVSPVRAQSPNPGSKDGTATVAAQYGKLPLAFEANSGQASDEVRFLSHSAGQLLLLEKGQAELRLAAGPSAPAEKKGGAATRDDLKIRFVGANAGAEIVPLDIQPGKTNYVLGNDPEKWRTNIDNYARVRYTSLYPGVDLVFYGNQSRLEHDFIVAPGADYRQIALQLSGSRKVRLERDGSVTVELAGGDVHFSAPRIYQVRGGREVEVAGGYTVKKNLLAFNVGPHDASLALVIDPILSYSTYLAGSTYDSAAGIALDSAGNAYVTGLTFSTDFPTVHPYQPACNGCANAPDVFVTKLNPTGTALVYSTYLGGSNYDQAFSIAVDGSGHAIVVGETSSTDFPLKSATPITTQINQTQGFVTSLSKDGTTLNFSTLLGGTGGGLVASVATDSHANVYVQGSTASADFPVKPATNVIGSVPGYNGTPVIFVAKFTAVGALTWGTTIGFDPAIFQQTFGSLYSPTFGGLMAVDANQDVYISGGAGPGFLVTPGAFQTTYTGPTPGCGSCTMGFVAELKPDGSAFVFATYLGGSSGDQVTGLTLDASRNIYVTGDTDSPDFPVTAGAFQSSFPGAGVGNPETFVAKLNPTGSALVYSSFFGAPNSYGQTFASGIAIDAAGEAFVTGQASSSALPLLNPLQSTVPSGDGTGGPATYVTKFNSEGTSILFSTLFSGSIGSRAAGIALNPAAPNDVYIAGDSYDNSLPTTPGAFRTSIPAAPPYDEQPHVFITKFDLGVAAPAVCVDQTSVYIFSSVNKTSAPQPLVLTNCGNGPLSVSNVVVTGPFKETNNCQSEVQPGMTCAVNVTFKESARGNYTGTLTINDNAPISSLTISLTGQATAPVVEVSSNPFTLDEQLVGQTGVTEPLFVFNVGDDVLSITSATVSGADFTVKKQDCLSVQPSNACIVFVTFHPTAAGMRTAPLTLVDNAADSPQTVTLQGTGLSAYPVPTIASVSPNTMLQGAAAQTINIFGDGFFAVSQIVVQGTALATTYNGESSLSATIPASLLTSLNELEVTVYNPGPGGGVSNSSTILVYQDLPIGANGLIYEPYTRRIYASIASSSPANPNSIVTIDPETETLGAPVAVGAGPNHMALTADSSLLYVGLDGASAIQQVQIPSGKLGTSTSLAALATGQPVNAFQIAVIPGKEQIYVASIFLPYTDPAEDGVALVSNGKVLSTLPYTYPKYTAVDSICFLSDPTTFYGSNGTQLYRFSVLNNASLGVTLDSSSPQFFGTQFTCDGKYIYDYSGLVFDPIANQTLGNYEFPGAAGGVVPDDSVGRTYALSSGQAGLLVYDQKTFAQVGSDPLPSMGSFPNGLIRWGTNGFAYLSYNFNTSSSDLILLRSSFAEPSSGPNPIPTVAGSSPEVPAGNGNYQLTVTGTNFVPGAVVLWNGSQRTTIFQSSTVLIADIPASDVTAAGSAEITVQNPPFTRPSNQHKYTITAAK